MSAIRASHDEHSPFSAEMEFYKKFCFQALQPEWGDKCWSVKKPRITLVFTRISSFWTLFFNISSRVRLFAVELFTFQQLTVLLKKVTSIVGSYSSTKLSVTSLIVNALFPTPPAPITTSTHTGKIFQLELFSWGFSAIVHGTQLLLHRIRGLEYNP